jgi:hypothetical protein
MGWEDGLSLMAWYGGEMRLRLRLTETFMLYCRMGVLSVLSVPTEVGMHVCLSAYPRYVCMSRLLKVHNPQACQFLTAHANSPSSQSLAHRAGRAAQLYKAGHQLQTPVSRVPTNNGTNCRSWAGRPRRGPYLAPGARSIFFSQRSL